MKSKNEKAVEVLESPATSEIKINIIEAASELAHNAARDEMMPQGNGLINDEEEMYIGEDHPDYEKDCSHYTDEAQEVFNRHYDYFYDKISNCQVKEEVIKGNVDINKLIIEKFKPEQKEMRVYLVDCSDLQDGEDFSNLCPDDDFMTEAEQQESVYTLEGFQNDINNNEIYTENKYIRFIEVPNFN